MLKVQTVAIPIETNGAVIRLQNESWSNVKNELNCNQTTRLYAIDPRLSVVQRLGQILNNKYVQCITLALWLIAERMIAVILKLGHQKHLAGVQAAHIPQPINFDRQMRRTIGGKYHTFWMSTTPLTFLSCLVSPTKTKLRSPQFLLSKIYFQLVNVSSQSRKKGL